MEIKTAAIIFFVIIASIMPIFTIVYDITDIRLILTSICWVFCIGVIGFVTINGIDLLEENTKTLKTSLDKNYKGYTDLDLGEDTFVYEGKKYSYSYDYDKKKLTVFLESSSSIDGVYVNGEKQNNTSSNSNSEKNDSDTETTNNKDILNTIKSKINEKYPNALITSFNPDYTGSFTYNDTYYNYSLKNDMLEIVNLNDKKDVVYYKILG